MTLLALGFIASCLIITASCGPVVHSRPQGDEKRIYIDLDAGYLFRAFEQGMTTIDIDVFAQTQYNWMSGRYNTHFENDTFWDTFYQDTLEPGDFWKNLFMNDEAMCSEVEALAYMYADVKTMVTAQLVYESLASYTYCLTNYTCPSSCSAAAIKIHSLDNKGRPKEKADHIAILKSDEWIPDTIEGAEEITRGMRSHNQVNVYTSLGGAMYTIVGYSDMVVGMTMWNDYITVTVNARLVDEFVPETVIANIQSGYAMPLALARKVISTCTSLDCALDLLRDTNIIAPAYFVVSTNVKAVAIARSADAVVRELTMRLGDSAEYFYVSNCDWWTAECRSLPMDPRQNMIEYELSLVKPFTFAKMYNFTWGPLSYPFRRPETLKVTMVDNAMASNYVVDSQCTLVSGPYCTSCSAACVPPTTCNEMHGICE